MAERAVTARRPAAGAGRRLGAARRGHDAPVTFRFTRDLSVIRNDQ